MPPRGRLQRITDWETIAVHSCYSSSALAQVCGVSLRHLQRHIRSAHGQNLGQWLNGLRLEHARRKLTSGCTVKETAYSLGFKQVSHFSRLFKKRYGITPSSVPITVGLPANLGCQ
ncbi:MAG: helix-turn-helix domain-containing protein [Chthoniobacterales bacterium]